MKSKLLLAVLLICSWFSLGTAAQFKLQSEKVAATICTQGGGLTHLSLDNMEMNILKEPGPGFTERAMRAVGKKQIIENFASLEFEPLAIAKDQVSLTALGVHAFDWLRITKTYRLDGKKEEMNVTWKLQNISDKPWNVGLWTRTFIRRHNMAGIKNLFYIPRNGKVETYSHPGGVRGDFWTTNPAYAFLACASQDDGAGAVILLPPTLVTAFNNYFCTTTFLSTMEWFLREQTIPPHTAKDVQVTVRLRRKLAEELKKPEIASRKIQPTPGLASMLPQMYGQNDKTITASNDIEGVMTRSLQHLDISGKRQYLSSVRGVRVPGTMDQSRISVFQQANGAPLLDRPVPYQVQKLADGDLRILVHVPGINPEGYYYTKFKDGFAFDSRRKDALLGPEQFSYRLCFDLPGQKPAPADSPLFADGVNLVFNGDFERKFPKVDWPDGYFWSWAARNRRLYYWEKTSQDGSRCIRIQKSVKEPHWDASFSVYFRPERGVKYTASCLARTENTASYPTSGGISFQNADKKEMRQQGVRFFLDNTSFPWKKYERTFYVPENTHYGVFHFGALKMNQTVWVDKVSIVPEDFRYRPRSPLALLRDEVRSSRYTCLDFIENLSHQIVTPHVKWLTDTVDAKPDVLYLPMSIDHILENPERRQILEFLQRMDLTYQYIPLLRKILTPHSWDPVFDDTLENYTLYQLKHLKDLPKVVIVQAVDFKSCVHQDFVDLIRDYQKRGSNILFYNCLHVPQSLLGTRTTIPDGIFATPKFRHLPPYLRDQACKSYLNGKSKVICFTRNASQWYIDARLFECTPPEKANEMCAAYHSLDFPYWEYIYLSALKCIRYLADIKPAARVVANDKEAIRVDAARDLTANLLVACQDLNRQDEGQTTQQVQLKKGTNLLPLRLPPLSGGQHVANYWLKDQNGKTYDCGAILITKKDEHPITITFKDPDRIFERGKPVVCQIQIQTPPADARLVFQARDTNGRVVAAGDQKARDSQKISFTIMPPYTTIYYLLVKLQQQDKPLSHAIGNFSMPAKEKDVYQMDAMIWSGRVPLVKVYADMGFNMSIANLIQDSEKFGRLWALRNSDVEPLGYGLGYVKYTKGECPSYRGDAPTPPVRKPCFSDPEHWRMVSKDLGERIKNQRLRFYGVNHFEIADEAFLGSTVCYSKHCLAGFRQELQKSYGSLEALNRSWDTSFASWDQVIPVQLKELKTRDNMAPWLDHKLYMASVFARKWVGNTKKAIRQYLPGAKVGLSGTQIPGYSYDWSILMEPIDCLSYYSGVQRKLVHDFAAPGFVSGQWGGGYIPAEKTNEFYEKSNMWEDLFLGANMASNYSGHSYSGDLSPSKNVQLYSELLLELRRGLARIVLHAPEIKRDVAVLYSQPSLFAALGGIGGSVWHNGQNGWFAILNDLKYSFKYVAYSELDREVPEVKVVVLPVAIALSDQAIANLREFVRKGGTVLADIAPGWYDNHGKRRENANNDCNAFFGIDRAKAALTTATLDVDLKFPDAISGKFQIGEKQLKAASGGQRAGMSRDGNGVYFVNRIGKGRVVLLNLSLGAYQALNLGGVGGELVNIKSGAAVLCDQLRHMVGRVLADAGAQHNSVITSRKDGKLFPCTTTLRQDGKNYVFGINKHMSAAPDGNYPMLFHPRFTQQLHVKLPVSGFIYNIRKGTLVTRGDAFDLDLIPGDGQLFAILKDKPTKLKLDLPKAISRGQRLTVGFKAAGGSGPHVFQLDMIDPQGKPARTYAQSIHVNKPKGKITFQTAFNDTPGNWRVKVTDVNSGITAQKEITFR